MGIVRSTFIIGADGVVLKVMPSVKPATHAEEVLATLATAAV
jgi:peroxiredoxin Q/BCP